MRILIVAVACLLTATTANADRSAWLTLSSSDESSYAVRVLVPPDESRIILDTDGWSIMSGSQHVATDCPAEGLAATADCDHFWIVVPEGGSDPDDGARFERALTDGEFRAVTLRRAHGARTRIGKLSVRIDDRTLTVRRGKRVVSEHALDGRYELSGVGLTSAGNLAVVLDGWRALLVRVP